MIPTRDGGLLIADAGNAPLRKVEPEGTIDTIAGNGTRARAVTAARRPGAAGVPVGDRARRRRHHLLRRRRRTGCAASRRACRACSWRRSRSPPTDGRSLYVFDPNGRHLRTVDTLTKATVLRFGYDGRGRLTSITDGDGDKTTIPRDANGMPTAIVAPYGQATTLAPPAAT